MKSEIGNLSRILCFYQLVIRETCDMPRFRQPCEGAA